MGCNGGSSSSDETNSSKDDSSETNSSNTVDGNTSSSTNNGGSTTMNRNVDISKFYANSIVTYSEVNCSLSNSETSTCYKITISGFPADRNEIGPFCPKTIDTNSSSAGKWFNNGVLYDLNGKFIQNLAVFYNDSAWRLYEDNGSVKITSTQTSCEAAARPNVDIQYNNYCVECDINYYSSAVGKGVESTYLIPKTPISASSSSPISQEGVGISLNGVKLEAAAPVNDILRAHTIAAFDDCVGHVNPIIGYHYHGANHGDGSCPAIDFESDGHAGMIGYALDGYAIYGMLDKNGSEAKDLDSCRGHSDDIRGYHYHTAGAGENAFIGCFKGITATKEITN